MVVYILNPFPLPIPTPTPSQKSFLPIQHEEEEVKLSLLFSCTRWVDWFFLRARLQKQCYGAISVFLMLGGEARVGWRSHSYSPEVQKSCTWLEGTSANNFWAPPHTTRGPHVSFPRGLWQSEELEWNMKLYMNLSWILLILKTGLHSLPNLPLLAPTPLLCCLQCRFGQRGPLRKDHWSCSCQCANHRAYSPGNSTVTVTWVWMAPLECKRFGAETGLWSVLLKLEALDTPTVLYKQS